MSCCDFDNDIYDNKIKKLENNLKNFEKEQNKTNAEIYTLLKQSGVDLSQYYALNEDDYTKTLTSEDDINTLEPGTYKIVSRDMPQNAPSGVVSTEYDGTLIQSNSYALLYADGFGVYHRTKTSEDSWKEWNKIAFMSDVPSLAGYATQEWVKQNSLIISRPNYTPLQTNEDLNNIKIPGAYYVNGRAESIKNRPPSLLNYCFILRVFNTCYNTNYYQTYIEQVTGNIWIRYFNGNIWNQWIKIANTNDIPSLDGYATQDWVNQQIQDITGGSVTADWVKSNYYPLKASQYYTINEATAFSDLKIGITVINSNNIPDKSPIIPNNANLIILKRDSTAGYYSHLIFDATNFNYYQTNSNNTSTKRFAYSNEVPSLNGYATQAWVQSQKYLTEIPDDYATDTEVSQAIATALVGYATQAWVNEQISEITGGAVTTDIVAQMISDAIVGYATQSWVKGRGYQTATQVSAAITAAITGYATEQYVNKNYLAIEKDLYKSIPVNSDLNNYITKGNYGCFLNANVPSIQNKPIGLTKAFKLVVEEIVATDQLIQKITENYSANMYYRTYSGGNWRNWEKVALMTDLPNLTNYATKEWVGQQGYQTVQQVNSLIKNATADMLTQEDLDTFNYATENWVLQTALEGYAKTTIDDSLATRPSQEFDRFMIRSTDYHGVNAVSGAEGYLVMHMAVDPDSPTKFIRSSGIVANNKYVNTFSTSDESSVGLSTNNVGTVTVVGMSNNAKQMFILVKPDNME